MSEQVHPLKVVSLLLQYPEPELVDALRSVDPKEVGPASGSQRATLGGFLDWYRSQDLAELRQSYVDNFDFDRRHSLHLTYQLYGDSRQRGLALLKIKNVYRDADLELSEGELPDYLPLMLEFATLAPGQEGGDLLDRHRESIELIRAGLIRSGSPWASLFDVIRDGMPGLSRRQINRIKRLAEEGPPSEEVGMEPFAPPEVMPSQPGEVPLPMIGGRS
ncbi:MAG TPA: nitrate reductase molybdenum cofactor assembly chaperone [Solirubrobacterales bacterium]|nr:nitrate reductase molybdenum cofactor assembly chaperone [Solirubrobacterales bacterium]HMU26777.1 nitrate reductase molybdenum cofactor assembly chaperone [Solirubrobacterales bacterium]HMX71043.1 nitrate reductase molybdenum cofactor assembly chaperone [Solirubrobacterales bacterium]HMY26542.1 nitrate reductase molybdenum cofactor assembly chaperone [Solirubrobacterales bacterium]HNA24851.1 nitrate reductase molybdenum cofactor assembly chaperone [Solirubrobacterales bacterium]